MAVFAENIVFTHGMGVSRLLKLVEDRDIRTLQYCIPIILVQLLSAPLGWMAHDWFFPWVRDYLPGWLPVTALRPIVYLTCATAAMAVVWLILCIGGKRSRPYREQLPFATYNCCILGTILICANQNFTLLETVGFSLGSGIGYLFGRGHRGRRPPPSAQQGCPRRVQGPAQFADLHRHPVPCHLRPGGPFHHGLTPTLKRRDAPCPTPPPNALHRPASCCPHRARPLDPWACIAVDQFTSQPEYWQKAEALAKDKPSTLHIVLPEAYLGAADEADRLESIRRTMADYRRSLLTRVVNGFVYLERTQMDGTVRQGLVGCGGPWKHTALNGTPPPPSAPARTRWWSESRPGCGCAAGRTGNTSRHAAGR